MQTFTIQLPRGDSIRLEIGPVVIRRADGTKTPIDLTVGGTKMWLTVKQTLDDADVAAEVQLTEGAGITLNSPVTVDKNMATARIPKEETQALAVPDTLYCDVQLQEPDGTKTTLAIGTIELLRDATRA